MKILIPFLMAMVFMIPAAFAFSNYDIADPSPTIVTTSGTVVTNDIRITSNQGTDLNLLISVACSDEMTLDKSCGWVSFENNQDRIRATVEPKDTEKIDYDITVPTGASGNHEFNFLIQDASTTNIKIVPVSLRLNQGVGNWITEKMPFLEYNVELPKPCLKAENQTVNGTVQEVCVQKIGMPVWFIIILTVGGLLIIWRLRR